MKEFSPTGSQAISIIIFGILIGVGTESICLLFAGVMLGVKLAKISEDLKTLLGSEK